MCNVLSLGYVNADQQTSKLEKTLPVC
ncbi:rCG53786 [Rattus norvegicus]|uniref:RCG53786 n=1 Tax=Rattus norvegicus TaxID=10116 RepID=A6J8B6_RAT|nr:rCG53786 [Rattus norvegicus]